MQTRFVHLHLHTEFSLVDSVVRIKSLASKAAELGMPAIAMTDQTNLFAMVKFYRAMQSAGVKPIIGADVNITSTEDPDELSKLVLLCQNRHGYLNLSELLTQSYLEGQQHGMPVIQSEWLQQHHEGLIVLSAGREGEIGQYLLAGDTEKAEKSAKHWLDIFGDRFYLELQRTDRAAEEDYLHAALELASKYSIPVVATNDVRYIDKSDYEAHEARVCINDGRTLNDSRRPRHYSNHQYLRTADEMCDLFQDIPEAIENSLAIAERCNLVLELGKHYLPEFPVPEGMTIEEFLAAESRKGLQDRLQQLAEYGESISDEQRKVYEGRLELELDVINNMGFPGYFLIVADFIRWAKQNHVPVGPGRGSGAGSLVAYALLITDLDPIKYDLLFERFLNPERVSLPDFDVDFCMEGRDRVIDYVAQHYGRDHVSQIITYGTMAAKAVVRDVGRVLGHPYGFVDQIAKLIPFEIGITLSKALEQEEELARRYEEDEEVHALIDLARSLEGITRNAGKHAGGVVIAPSVLTDFTPLYCEQDATSIVTQFDKDDVESVGLVKFDFLGLRTLTIIDWAIQTVNAERETRGEHSIDIASIAMDDEKVFQLLKACATTAVFQLESRGMKELIKRLQPDSFDDIVALVALFRPGPLQSGMVDDFIERKHGKQVVVYPHPDLEPVLKPTYGVILYQEQVMQIAQVLAGYSLGGADLLRRAMGKKKPEEMAKQRSIFTEGAVERGVEEEQATYIFDLMEKFAGYGFNKSHSAAYALVSYQTAWLKAHYPAAFMAAVLSSDMDNTDKVVMLIDECRGMGLAVLPPNVNECAYRFTVKDDNSIYYGLGAIKGVGEGAIESIVEEREQNGLYQDLFEFCRRIDVKKANKRVFEGLIRSGALDVFAVNRATLFASIPLAMKSAEQYGRDMARGQDDMFGSAATASDAIQVEYAEAEAWSDDVRLEGEKETLGLYLTGHPLDKFRAELNELASVKLGEISDAHENKELTLAGLIIGLQKRNTRTGEPIMILTLDDGSSRIEAILFRAAYKSYHELMEKDKVMILRGSIARDRMNEGFTLRINDAYDIDTARQTFARRLIISLDAKQSANGFVPHLAKVLQPYRDGGCPVAVEYQNQEARARLQLGEEWAVNVDDNLLSELRHLTGTSSVRVIY